MNLPYSRQSRGGPDRGQSRLLANQKGQLVVEYILLLIIAVSIAMIVTTSMVSRNEEDPGFMITKWRQIIDAISQDITDDLTPEQN